MPARREFLKRTAAFLALSAASAPSHASRIEMLYLATPDCPYCRSWEARSKDALLNSPEGRALRFVEVRGETLRKPIAREHYPRGYEWAFDKIGPSRGVPRFVLLVDGNLLLSAFGLNAYENDFLPRLRAIVAGGPGRA